MFKGKDEPKTPDHGLASVIMYEGDNKTFVYKHPIQNFNLGSQLIVHETQEAVFFRDGQALDLFGPGRHTLETQNLPIIGKAYKLPTNAETPFHCEVYFINKTVQMGIKWGTDTKVRFIEPESGLPIEIGACGQFNLRISDSRRLLMKLVGTAGEFTQADMVNGSYGLKPTVAKFKAMIINRVKSSLARIIKENNINILEIDERLDTISDKLCGVINENLSEYGLDMPEFFVETILTPDDDPNYRRLKQQHADLYLKVRQEEILKAEAEKARERQAVEAETAAQLKVISAKGEADALVVKAAAEAEEMRMKGFTYREQTAREVGLGAVTHMGGGSGGGNAVSDIAGLGVALGAMGGVMDMTKNAMNPMTAGAAAAVGGLTAGGWTCSCGNTVPSGDFCNACGKKRPGPADTWDCSCGNKGIIGNFCNNCGAKRPAVADAWDCSCGNKGIVGNFCNNCGAKRPGSDDTWDCSCGEKNNTGNFCRNCGKKKGE
ncbi:MAG: SPFH domain-containing protein [Ruminococcus sp.]|nr:SPFH domain-containing protein [Ruminococcus sp.]